MSKGISGKVQVGDRIEIITMQDEPQYNGAVGVATHIDDIGNIHGTWGGLAIVPEVDCFRVIPKSESLYKKAR